MRMTIHHEAGGQAVQTTLDGPATRIDLEGLHDSFALRRRADGAMAFETSQGWLMIPARLISKIEVDLDD
ncbi:hypothetical protein [Streptomyces tsukubensis]|uniref:hypothetical protein n=1 Tax=Streptomyces tsukubensis TaxID=83656 RepID=UPI00344C313B